MDATEQVPATRTLGVDLASQPKDTGICLIDWKELPAQIVPLEVGKPTDDVLLALMNEPDTVKVGIDAPFGWPLAFIDAISAYRDHSDWLDMAANEMRFRATDMQVERETGQTPLSVAMSDLAWPAMRCARLLSQLASNHGQLDRSGAGRFVEVYPAAALRRWGLITPGAPSSEVSYKGDQPGRTERRAKIMVGLRERLAGSVELSDGFVAACQADDDDLDAFVCALMARAVQVAGASDPIPVGLRWAALREGWIHLPTAESLSLLSPTAS